MTSRLWTLLLTVLLAFPAAVTAAEQHALSIGVDPALPPGFTHYPYANPDAPKGGTLRLATVAAFDSFHSFIARGIPAPGSGLTTARLGDSSRDEPFTQYASVARSFEVAPDRSSVIVHLNPAARFSDGVPVTSADVVFTFTALTTKGSPTYLRYYSDVESVKALDAHTVRFDFVEANNPELPYLVGQVPVLPKHWWEGRDFAEPTLDVPPGCGPYKVKSFRPGYSIVYERVRDWWGKDLPVNKGRYNFDIVRYDVYRDRTVTAEAFRSGEFDFRAESSAKAWAQDYTGPAIRQGLIKRAEFTHSRPAGMMGFVFNTRNGLFSDRRVRKALALAFDFQWTNKALFYGQYKRCDSYFTNSVFAAQGSPSAAELAILEPLRGSIPAEAFGPAVMAPRTDGSGRLRGQLRKALALLREAGWTLKDGTLRNKAGQPFVFEMLLRSPTMERVALPLGKNLAKLGITMNVAMADASRYVRRVRAYDFDMISTVIRQSDSPGNEQRFFWTSDAAKTPGTRNLAGVSSPAVDKLVETLIAAKDRDTLTTCVRALDRVLRSEWYAIPGWYSPVDRFAYWDVFGMPQTRPSRGLDIFSWWYDADGAKRVAQAGFRSGGENS